MKRIPRVKIVCPQCKCEFDIEQWKLRKPTKYGRFCSASCRSKYVAKFNPASQPDLLTVSCHLCEQEFEIQRYRQAEKVFCSKSCAAKYGLSLRWKDGPKMIIVSCAYCEQDKEIPAWDHRLKSERGQEQFFCDRACFGKWKAANWQLENNPSWKGGWTPHGSGWKIIRTQVREEQNRTCAVCGITEDAIGRSLDVHHIIPARLFKRKADASFRTNLIGLCHRCHMKRETENVPLFKN